eukprot:9652253-Ditylum_brightwellii.AAC.1
MKASVLKGCWATTARVGFWWVEATGDFHLGLACCTAAGKMGLLGFRWPSGQTSPAPVGPGTYRAVGPYVPLFSHTQFLEVHTLCLSQIGFSVPFRSRSADSTAKFWVQ